MRYEDFKRELSGKTSLQYSEALRGFFGRKVTVTGIAAGIGEVSLSLRVYYSSHPQGYDTALIFHDAGSNTALRRQLLVYNGGEELRVDAMVCEPPWDSMNGYIFRLHSVERVSTAEALARRKP